MIQARAVAQRRISSSLPILAMGLINVGNWVEFWAAWFGDEKQVIPMFNYPSKSSGEDFCVAYRGFSLVQRALLCQIYKPRNPSPPLDGGIPNDYQ